MKQEKLNKDRVLSEAKQRAYSYPIDTEQEKAFMEGFKQGVEFQQDQDPWFYIEDGELPDSFGSYFVLDNNNFGYRATWYLESQRFKINGIFWSLNEIKCFMPIPKSQK